MSNYVPMGRRWEMEARAELPEYRELRAQAAGYWRRARKQNAAEARGRWVVMRRAQRETVRMITDNMFYAPQQPPIDGLQALLFGDDVT